MKERESTKVLPKSLHQHNMQIRTTLLALAAANFSVVNSVPVGRNHTDIESSNDAVSALNFEGLSICKDTSSLVGKNEG